jgi:hypothetical protein
MPSLSFPETGVFLGPRRGTPPMLSENGPLNPHIFKVAYQEAAFKWLFKKSYLKATSRRHFKVAFSGTGNKVGF